MNGERTGKGKEYYEFGELKFEGEYLYGEKTGKGKKYFRNGELRFVGEYLNGKKNGKVIKYFSYDELKFEGEYSYGKKMEKEKNIFIYMYTRVMVLEFLKEYFLMISQGMGFIKNMFMINYYMKKNIKTENFVEK